MSKFEFTGVINPSKEDSGQALIAEVEAVDPESHLFIRIQSWDEEIRSSLDPHPEMTSIIGKKVKVTIEVID